MGPHFLSMFRIFEDKQKILTKLRKMDDKRYLGLGISGTIPHETCEPTVLLTISDKTQKN